MFSLLLAVSVAVSAAPPPAKAPDPAKAKELFNTGKKLYDLGKYGDAVKKFEEAYVARPHPVILFNIGKCYELLGETGKGETGKALRAYRDYLRALPDASDKVAVGDSIANLERKLKDRGLQQVLVFADPATATIEIDGKDLGVSPASTELSPGPHKLVARAEGFTTVERSFTMSAVRSQEVTINLAPAGTPPVADAPKKDDGLKQPGNASITEPTPTPAASTTPPESIVAKKAPAKAGGTRVFTWVAAGGAVVAGGVGAGLGVMAGGASSELHRADASRTRAQADALVSKANSMALGANVAYGVAGAAAITAVVLFFVEGR
ncbi:MAG: hypothetical protein H6Q89_1271 [Myxococcaceae bacterium]|nr:hypothetical protein [Myxococcaceae bacterium]